MIKGLFGSQIYHWMVLSYNFFSRTCRRDTHLCIKIIPHLGPEWGMYSSSKDYHIITPFLDQTTNTTSYYCTMPISRLKAASLLAPENCQRWGSSFLSYKLPRGISLIQIPSHCAMKNALKIQQISLILTVNHTDNSKWQIENNPEKMLCPKD